MVAPIGTGLAKHAKLGDKRLNTRLGSLYEDLFSSMNDPIPQAISKRGDVKATYRFFQNEKVSPELILQAHVSAELDTSLNSLQEAEILAIQDTTELDFTGTKGGKALDCLNYPHRKGLFLHTTLLSDKEGVPLCLLQQHSWGRKPEALGTAKERKYEPIEQKESYRWVEGFQHLIDRFRNDTHLKVQYVADREADIYELFCLNRPSHIDFLVRSQYNRRLKACAETGRKAPKLWEAVAAEPLAGVDQVEVTNPKNFKKRQAKLEIRYRQVSLSLSRPRPDQRKLPEPTLWVVEAKEVDAPKGIKPILWRLLTSRPMETLAQALACVKTYTLRWVIERFHYVLKSGARIEKLQLEKPHRLKNAIALYGLIALNMMKINYFARKYPEESVEKIGISKAEYTLLFCYIQQQKEPQIQYPLKEPPSVSDFVRRVAQMGGFMNYKYQKYPGMKTFWRGMKRFHILLQDFQLFQELMGNQ